MAPMFHFKECFAVILLLLAGLNFTSGGKLLVIPMDGSHWLSMKPVLKQLRQNGHEMLIVAPEINVHIKPSEDIYSLKTYPVPFTYQEMDENIRAFGNQVFEDLPFLVMVARTIERLKKTSAFFLAGCTHLLNNQELMRYLEQSKFDALFTDPMLPCGQIVAEYLGIPSVFFLRGIPCGFDSEATQCPSPPSYVPRTFTRYSDHMTFAQRVKNMLFRLSESFLCSFVYSPYANLASEFLQRDMTVAELLSNGSVWLMREDYVSNFPKPLMPNMIPIGGINCAGREPLSQVCTFFYSFIFKSLG
ncbi:hypothetical protein JD844_023331 [Phrynosoma platyrhinos]|uniref:UDP-glucuronosyltransferase 1A1 n=1 Tax=Phrynosoma platyrhinos TaxID=52577 RepID=A0ABQ7SWW4_PHRPL|nr:hypothetical protein JD844_023331 [Phrynosoma platyrhinos]